MILNIENGNFIKKVMDFINNEKSNFWNELTESELEEIKKGMTQLDNGNRTPNKDVLKRFLDGGFQFRACRLQTKKTSRILNG